MREGSTPGQKTLQEQSADRKKARVLASLRTILELPQKNNIRLLDYRHRATELVTSMHDDTVRASVNETLIARGHLKPDLDLFWRVDRSIGEYNARTGVNIIAFAKALSAGETGPHIIFEAGAGTGNAIAERSQLLNDDYVNFAINDEVYYPLRKLINSCIDFQLLSESAGVQKLPTTERAALVDYIFKVLYLKAGETTAGQTDDIRSHYDRETITQITNDPNTLKVILAELGPKLSLATAVPSEHGILPQPDGTQRYPKTIEWQKQSPSFQAMFELFRNNPGQFLRDDLMADDLKKYIPDFPAGMMLVDFSAAERLAPNQITLGFDVRATMYLEGEAYINYLVAAADKLKEHKAYVSDSARENFGKVYRLPELIEVQRRLGPGYTLYIVMGPGVPGDDYNQKQAIRSVVIGKKKKVKDQWIDFPIDTLSSNLASAAYSVRPLTDVVMDNNYLRKLDPEEQNYARTQAALKVTPLTA